MKNLQMYAVHKYKHIVQRAENFDLAHFTTTGKLSINQSISFFKKFKYRI